MSVERKSIARTLLNRHTVLKPTGEPTGSGGWGIEVRHRITGELLACIDSDAIFDKDGNRFHYDAE